MKIKTISYQKTFAIAPFLNEKIGVEIEVSSDPHGNDSEAAIKAAKETIERWHKEFNPQLFDGKTPSPTGDIPERQVEKNVSPLAKMISEINTCKEVKVLETYKFLVKGKPELQEAYDNKLKTLSNGLEQN